MGSEFYPVFKMIPLHKTPDQDNYVSINFENLEFIKCNTTRLDFLQFHLKRLDGEFIDFDSNEKIIINLAVQNR